MAPTKRLAEKKMEHELEMCKLKAEWQQEKINELREERDYLKEQLAAALKKDGTASTSTLDTTSTSTTRLSSHSSDISMESSSESTSDSSFDMSSSEDKKKKRRKKKGKGEKKRKKSKKMNTKTRQRAQNPNQVVARYTKILKLFNKGGTMSAAFSRVSVDRNTVVANAPIAELFIAAPSKYNELIEDYNVRRAKLSAFAIQCEAAIKQDPDVQGAIQAYKASGKLLPISKK
ncbi:coiled-coil domain-containing protein 106-like [Cololabis saira]|uniref:coiled-coil domain-containing protein 106-like n=1 Tax=Cololabis saira TaxID=129043 RepID=UPI002AD58B37|nr:coiled-coil domain-containing protein 106-like [Cololabis saira]